MSYINIARIYPRLDWDNDIGKWTLREEDLEKLECEADLSPVWKWVDVKDRLPKENANVLILCKNGAMFTGYHFVDYKNDARWCINTALGSTKLLNKGRVSHWMHLPEPPQKYTPTDDVSELF